MIARLLLCLVTVALSATVLFADSRVVYVSDSEEITVYEVDGETGELTGIQKIAGNGPLALSPDRHRLYAIGKEMSSFAIKKDGKLGLFKTIPVEQRASYLGIDSRGAFLAASYYQQGKVCVWKIGSNGICEGEKTADLTLEEKTHSAVFAPSNRFLLVPATGPNKVFQLAFDSTTGEIDASGPSYAPGPTDPEAAQQPRHIIFHPDGKTAYTTQERDLPGVAMWRWDGEAGSLECEQTIVTIPEGFGGTITTADLHLTPDAKFLYASNRDLTDRKVASGDSSIVRFSVDPETRELALLGYTPCEHIPRSFAIDDSGEYLYVAGQMANKLGAYRIDSESGNLERVQQLDTGSRPTWVTCLTLP